jgi:hypothetical protein
MENGSVATAYQKGGATGTDGNPLDITGAGVASYNFVRPDLSDDVLPIISPQAITGDLVIMGRNGSWVEPATVAAGGTLNVGPTGTLATPGILRAVGDIVDMMLRPAMTPEERARFMMKYRAEGAAGWLVEGPELLSNGTFTSNVTGWVEGFAAGNSSFVSSGGKGLMTVTTAGPTSPRWVTTLAGLTIGVPLILRCGEFTTSGGGGDRYIGVTDQAQGVGTGGGGFDKFSLHTEPRVFVPTVSTLYLWVGFNNAVNTSAITVDNLSAKALIPEVAP